MPVHLGRRVEVAVSAGWHVLSLFQVMAGAGICRSSHLFFFGRLQTVLVPSLRHFGSASLEIGIAGDLMGNRKVGVLQPQCRRSRQAEVTWLACLCFHGGGALMRSA